MVSSSGTKNLLKILPMTWLGYGSHVGSGTWMLGEASFMEFDCIYSILAHPSTSVSARKSREQSWGSEGWGQPWSTGDNPVPPGQTYAAPLRKTVVPFLSLFQAVKGRAGQVISSPMAIKEAL